MPSCEHLTAVNIPSSTTPIHAKECCFCHHGVESISHGPDAVVSDHQFSFTALLTTKPNFPTVGHNVCLTCFTGGCGGSNHGHALRHWDATKHHILVNLQYQQPTEEAVVVAMAAGQPIPASKCTPTVYCIQCDAFQSIDSSEKLQQSISAVLSLPDALKLKEFDAKAASQGGEMMMMSDEFPLGPSCNHCNALGDAQQEHYLVNLEQDIQTHDDGNGKTNPRSYIVHNYTDPQTGSALTKRIWLGENYLPDLSTAPKPLDEKELASLDKVYPPLPDGTQAYNKYQCRDCDISTNLWMCMTCGYFGCARKDYDGSGGNNHAVEHNKATGHPLVIKIATVSANSGDIWCYSCDDSIQDKELKDHLMAFNLDIGTLTKSEKSLEDMQLELNMTAQFASAFNRDGFSKPLLFGQGFTGIENFGNCCYMSAISQLYFRIPNIYNRYYIQGKKHVETCRNGRPGTCVLCQFFKFTHGLFSGEYSPTPIPALANKYITSVFTGMMNQRLRQDNGGMLPGTTKRSSSAMVDDDHSGSAATEGAETNDFVAISPGKKQRNMNLAPTATMMANGDNGNDELVSIGPKESPSEKTTATTVHLQHGTTIHSIRKLLNDNHPEFGNLRQQDAHEFLVHLRDYTQSFEKSRCPQASKIDTATTPNINDAFAFKTQQVITCGACSGVHYKYGDNFDFQLELDLPVEIVDPSSADNIITNSISSSSTTPEKDKKYQPQHFSNCLAKFSQEQTLVGFRCPNPLCQTMSKCVSKNTILTLPEYLTVQVKRFIVDTTTWSFTKNNAPLLGTEDIDLTPVLTANAPDLSKITTATMSSSSGGDNAKYQGNAEMMAEMLMAPICLSIDLLKKCGNDVDTATELYFGLDSQDHFPGCGCPGQESESSAAAASNNNNNNNNPDDPITKTVGKLEQPLFDPNSRQTRGDLNPKYNLVGFVNHLGPSAKAGHYVAHIKASWNQQHVSALPHSTSLPRLSPSSFNTMFYTKDHPPTQDTDVAPCFQSFDPVGNQNNCESWVCYNDNKVFVNDEPPNDQAYVLLFKRVAD